MHTKTKKGATAKGPQALRFIKPVLSVLRSLGGSGTAAEVIDLVIEQCNLSEEELAQTIKRGGSKVRNQVQFARLYLVKAGYLTKSERGVWSLTKQGYTVEIDAVDLLEVFREARRVVAEEKGITPSPNDVADDEVDVDAVSEVEESPSLLQVLQSLPPAGFERVCQQLLREAGFQQVVVTGKSGDGGIDGHGVLQINHLVTFKVLFQCKRYQGSVSASTIRDFRGAMMGRADKGIIITTGTFTPDAKREAIRDGVPPLDLVDGEKLVEMFEQLKFGLIPRTVFDIDHAFFDQYR
jgi:restriction system protein